MTKNTLNKFALVTGIVCIALAIIIFLFADGLRRWYSGFFFTLMGIVSLINYFRWRQGAEE